MSNITNTGRGLPGQQIKRRMTINQIAEEDSPNVYIRNNAPKIHKTIAHILIPFTSSQTGDAKSIEVPMTTIPIDLANYAPKEELMRNPELRHIWNEGLIDFIPAEEAELELQSDDALAEQDRLMTARQTRNRSNPQPSAQSTAEQQREQNQQNQQLPSLATGEFDSSTANVNGAIVQAMTDTGMTEPHRLSLLKSMASMMTENDKKFVRSKTEDPEIRKLVG